MKMDIKKFSPSGIQNKKKTSLQGVGLQNESPQKIGRLLRKQYRTITDFRTGRSLRDYLWPSQVPIPLFLEPVTILLGKRDAVDVVKHLDPEIEIYSGLSKCVHSNIMSPLNEKNLHIQSQRDVINQETVEIQSLR